MIASLKRSIWDANPHPFLISFRQNFLQHYAAFWSNGHQIERDVKEAGYCDNTKRSEEVTSIYSICRSSIFPAISELVVQASTNFASFPKLPSTCKHTFTSHFY